MCNCKLSPFFKHDESSWRQTVLYIPRGTNENQGNHRNFEEKAQQKTQMPALWRPLYNQEMFQTFTLS